MNTNPTSLSGDGDAGHVFPHAESPEPEPPLPIEQMSEYELRVELRNALARIKLMDGLIARHSTERLSWMNEIRVAHEKANKAIEHLRSVYAIPGDTPTALYDRIIATSKDNAEAASNLRFLQREGWCWTNEQIDRYRGICRERRNNPTL